MTVAILLSSGAALVLVAVLLVLQLRRGQGAAAAMMQQQESKRPEIFEVSQADFDDYNGICLSCGEIHYGGVEPDARGYHCDACGADLVQRKDDTKEVIAERLQVYHKATRPLIQYYQEKNLYFGVDGDQPSKRSANPL